MHHANRIAWTFAEGPPRRASAASVRWQGMWMLATALVMAGLLLSCSALPVPAARASVLQSCLQPCATLRGWLRQ